MQRLALLLAGAGAGAAADAAPGSCSMSGAPWVAQAPSGQHPPTGASLYTVTATGADTFNMSVCWRHGPCGQGEQGTVSGDKVTIKVMDKNLTASTCEGTFSASCDNITWAPQPPKDPEGKPGTGCLNTASWCRAWTPGCDSPEPPYGQGFAFLSSLGSNMVLQQAPAKSAVYGIAVGKPTAVKVTVTDVDKKSSCASLTDVAAKASCEVDASYEVDAKFNVTKQPFGPEFVGGESGKGGYATAGPYIYGPHLTWKAFLKPTPAGGNYTIAAACTGCTEDGSFSNINITNVAFGDVWHCSGQSNMWLPVGNSFAHNDTIKNISAGKYKNIRLMAGNSGDCPGEGTTMSTGGQPVPAHCPWMTTAEAAVTPAKKGRGPAPVPPLFNFGAACWYFAAKISDELEAAGKLIPIGVTDTAIGGQRIEEYMVNDTSLTACSERTGENSPEWNGRLYGKQTLPFVDMTIKGWLWYQVSCHDVFTCHNVAPNTMLFSG